MMTRCVRPHAPAMWPLALPMIPYMRANLTGKQRDLRQADAIVAVSSAIAADLRARSAHLAAARMEIIPNAVDTAALDAAATASTRRSPDPMRSISASWRRTRARRELVNVIERAGLDWPVVVAGDGPERESIARDAARSTRDIRLVGWVDQRSAAAWMAHASMLVFPSRGPESLSRVLIEASVLGVPIAAMKPAARRTSFGTAKRDCCLRTFEELADDIRRLAARSELRRPSRHSRATARGSNIRYARS